jgi:hypothetical protein
VAAVVTDAINRAIERHTSRTANLSLQGYFASEQSRILDIHILRFLLGEAVDELPLILEECRKQAWANLKRQVGPVDGGEERAAWQS